MSELENLDAKTLIKKNNLVKFLRNQLIDINIGDKKDNLNILEYVVQQVEIYYSNKLKKYGSLKKLIVFEVLNFCEINFLNKHLYIALSRICQNRIINLIKRNKQKKKLFLL